MKLTLDIPDDELRRLLRELLPEPAAAPGALLSEAAAAAYLAVSRSSLGRERRAGKIAHTPVRGAVRYTREQLDTYRENVATADWPTRRKARA